MPRRSVIVSTLSLVILLTLACSAFAQQRAGGGAAPEGNRGQRAGGGQRATRPPLFFKEEWRSNGPEAPVVIEKATLNPNLELKLYGPTGKEILLTGNTGDENNPVHLWTGMCTSPCAFTLREKGNFADLTGLARIRVITKTSGFHKVNLIVKLADGTLLIGDHFEGTPVDWIENEFAVSELRWRKLDGDRVVTTGDWVNAPNLSRVDEIGFADLMPGSGHGQGGWSDVAKIEVYAKPVKREGSTNQ